MKSRLLKYAFMLLVAAVYVLYYMRFRQPYQIMSGETIDTYYRIKFGLTRKTTYYIMLSKTNFNS